MAASVHIKVESNIKLTPRVKQLVGMFDAPIGEKLSREWNGTIPIDERGWNVGLIVGPSGAGKSTVAKELFGERQQLDWVAGSVVDDFASNLTMEQITGACSAVGFNTIPSWAKPYHVLSTGEKFRVELARHLLEDADPVVIDEFTSVVDRQVAHIGSHAVQKFVRKHKRKFVAVTCHYDVIDWLQPDWVVEPATMSFQWRLLQRRPVIEAEIARVDYSAWKLFAPFHYMSADMHPSARCYVLYADGVPAAFAGVLYRPHPKARDIYGVSRLVTLPDYQGMGLAMILADQLGANYKALRRRLHTYPAHPSLIRAFDRSKCWALHKKPGFSNTNNTTSMTGRMGGRPNAVFEYAGPAATDTATAKHLIEG
jgi:ABC-type ATPase involved in cell division/GNAT superfamily N-acetyltransferase